MDLAVAADRQRLVGGPDRPYEPSTRLCGGWRSPGSSARSGNKKKSAVGSASGAKACCRRRGCADRASSRPVSRRGSAGRADRAISAASASSRIKTPRAKGMQQVSTDGVAGGERAVGNALVGRGKADRSSRSGHPLIAPQSPSTKLPPAQTVDPPSESDPPSPEPPHTSPAAPARTPDNTPPRYPDSS